MPYVDEEARDRLVSGGSPESTGELNYAITRFVDDYLRRMAERDGRLRYAHLNEAMGVLECAKLELYRRIAAPYEDGKIEENGDVYSAG